MEWMIYQVAGVLSQDLFDQIDAGLLMQVEGECLAAQFIELFGVGALFPCCAGMPLLAGRKAAYDERAEFEDEERDMVLTIRDMKLE